MATDPSVAASGWDDGRKLRLDLAPSNIRPTHQAREKLDRWRRQNEVAAGFGDRATPAPRHFPYDHRPVQ